MPNVRPETTLTQRIAAELRTSIHGGDYPPGHRLPSGRELMRKYGVARQTVQNAFDMLRTEGLIDTRTGSGTFVRHRPALLRLTRNRPARGSDGSVAMHVEPADAYSAEALGVTVGEELLVWERVVHVDGTPVQLATVRRPKRFADVAPPAGRFTEYVSTRPALPAEAAKLRLANATPVLTVTRIGFDQAGTAVELHDMILAGERYQLVYDLPSD